MENLYIIGAGGCGREVLQWAKDINKENLQWNIIGFLDDDLDALKGKKCEIDIVNTIDEYNVQPDDVFICSIGNSHIRKDIMEKVSEKGGKFINIIHPTATIADTSCIGNGVIIYPYALISDNAIVGDGCIVNMYSSIAHDSILGDYCTISAHCDVTGACVLGKFVFMGTTSNMPPSTKIGDNVYICAGSTVMGTVRDNHKLMGNPAKIVRF